MGSRRSKFLAVTSLNLLECLFLVVAGLLIGLSTVSPARCYNVFSFSLKTAQEIFYGFSPSINVFSSSPQAAQEKFYGFSPHVVAVLMITYTAVGWFGYQLSKPFYRGVTGSNRLLEYAAGFFIGYTCLLGPLRLLSLFLPYRWIYFYTMIFLIAGIAMLTKCFCSFPREKAPLYAQRVFSRQSAAWVLGLMVLLVSELFLSVHQGDFHFNGHGYNQYAYLLDYWKQDPPGHLLIVKKHYDELMFNYFLTLPLPKEFPNILSWWLTLGLMKVSVFAFIFLFLRKMGFSFIMSLISVLFLYAGTTSLLAAKYYMLFDSSNLLYFTVHSGRMVGIIFIFLMIGDALFSSSQNRLPLVFFLLSGLGIAATTLSNPFWLGVIYCGLVIYNSNPYASGKKFLDSNGTALCYSAVIASMMMYALDFKSPLFYKFRMAALILVAVLAVSRLLPKHDGAGIKTGTGDKLLVRQGAVLGAGLLIGLIFLGNIAAGNPWQKTFVTALKPIIGSVEIRDIPQMKGSPLVSEGGTFAVGDHRELGTFNEYCRGLTQFVDYYGLILMMILAVNYFIVRARGAGQEFLRADLVLYEIFLMAAASLPCFLFFTDFVQYGSRAWLKTRLLEIPVYVIILIFFYFVNRFCGKSQKIILGAVVLVYTFVPFVMTQRPEQIMYNFHAFLNHSCPWRAHGGS